MRVINPITDYLAKSLMTANGDLITRTAGVPARLALGNAMELLGVNSGGTGPQYFKGEQFVDMRIATNQPINSGSNTVVQYDAAVSDDYGLYDNVTNYNFTRAEAGIYLCIAGAQLQNIAAGNNVLFSIISGGSTVKTARIYNEGAAAKTLPLFVSSIVDLRGAVDDIEIRILHGEGTARSTSASTSECRLTIGRIF